MVKGTLYPRAGREEVALNGLEQLSAAPAEQVGMLESAEVHKHADVWASDRFSSQQ